MLSLIDKIRLCVRILRAKPSRLLEHAKRELPPAENEAQRLMNKQLCEVILVFSTHRHSGFSANYATALLEKLLRFEPLSPLTGADDEWEEISGGLYQNKRCSHVFKGGDMFNGQAYDIYAVVFRDRDGCTYTSRDSVHPITFPYTPTSHIEPHAEEA